MEIEADGSCKIFNSANKVVDSGEKTSDGQPEHMQKFIDCIRANDPSKLSQPFLLLTNQRCPIAEQSATIIQNAVAAWPLP